MNIFERCIYAVAHKPCVRWACWHNWRRWLKIILASTYFVVVLVAFPIMLWRMIEADVKAHIAAWFIAGMFVLLTLPIFMAGLVQHLINYTRPDLQRHIIRYAFYSECDVLYNLF